jgi:hypothetical protein
VTSVEVAGKSRECDNKCSSSSDESASSVVVRRQRGRSLLRLRPCSLALLHLSVQDLDSKHRWRRRGRKQSQAAGTCVACVVCVLHPAMPSF